MDDYRDVHYHTQVLQFVVLILVYAYISNFEMPLRLSVAINPTRTQQPSARCCAERTSGASEWSPFSTCAYGIILLITLYRILLSMKIAVCSIFSASQILSRICCHLAWTFCHVRWNSLNRLGTRLRGWWINLQYGSNIGEGSLYIVFYFFKLPAVSLNYLHYTVPLLA